MMNRDRILKNVVIVSMLALVVGLAGCSDATQAPSATATSPAAATTPTSQSDSGPATPTVAAAVTVNPVVTASTGSCSKLNLNSETEAELMATIPNFNSRMVREFLEYRPYASIQEFRRQLGKYIDASQVAEYEKYVYVPVDPNAADADTLKQIPGVDDAAATALIAGRPYATNDAFLQALGTHVSAQQLTGASCYLTTK
jgi:DNA uptake protein ComE-like DNA-binding protein